MSEQLKNGSRGEVSMSELRGRELLNDGESGSRRLLLSDIAVHDSAPGCGRIGDGNAEVVLDQPNALDCAPDVLDLPGHACNRVVDISEGVRGEVSRIHGHVAYTKTLGAEVCVYTKIDVVVPSCPCLKS